ncbi:MAG: hypothetical protein H0T62_07730 [Parachlamydiaceae bacterium]|nr:hypothetical protein [Parachlamydiaceae bacterium]
MDILNYFFNPGASENKVHWATDIAPENLPLPKRELEWYEETEKRNEINSIFISLGCVSAGVAILGAVCLTATLATVLVTATFALAATALLVAAVYLATMEPNELDPVYRLEKRQELLSRSEAPHYSELITARLGDILTEDEIQTVLTHEINRMDYDSFKQKHAIDGLRFLNQTNIALLRPNYLAYLDDFMIESEEGLDAILNSEEARIFALKLEELFNKKSEEIVETEDPEDEQSKTSLFETMGSYASSAFEVAKSSTGQAFNGAAKMALKVAKTVTPKPLVNVAQCTAASFTYATQGKFNESVNAALGAVTCATLFAVEQELRTENPEGYRIAKDASKFENFNNQVS